MRRFTMTAMALGLLWHASATQAALPTIGWESFATDSHGYTKGGRALVPFRSIAEWLGAQVSFADNTITCTAGTTTLVLPIGSKTATLNGQSINLDAKAQTLGGVTVVPLRLLAETFGADVKFISSSASQLGYPGRPYVEIRKDGKLLRILLHVTPPHVTAAVIRASGEQHGLRSLVIVERLQRGAVGGTILDLSSAPDFEGVRFIARNVKGSWKVTLVE